MREGKKAAHARSGAGGWPDPAQFSRGSGRGLRFGPASRHPEGMSRRTKSAEPPNFAFSPVKTLISLELAANGYPESKVVAVNAPTGYGKTVLLAALYQHYGRAGTDCRWCSLDDRDATVDRLLANLETALSDLDVEVDVLQAIHEGDEPIYDRLGKLLESLKLIRGPVVVFIDNLNYCADETLSLLLDALIFQTPSWIYFVLSSTTALPFNQARAKLEGALRPVAFYDLSLNGNDIRELLGPALCSKLPAGAIEVIQTQTEGWPAAVRLMQIILNSSSNPEDALRNFSGADEDLAALLNRQVLQAFDPRARVFLLEMSLLRTFGINLCQHATGEEKTAEYVNKLLAQNLFVIPLDRNRSWYRLHGLFREFLLEEARRQVPADRRRQILARAAEWCEHAGLWHDAVEYALEAESTTLVAAILERIAPMFVRDRGDLRRYIEWVEKLHATGASSGLEADFWYVWALIFHRRYEFARKQLNRLTARMKETSGVVESPDDAALRRRIDVIRIAIDVYTDYLDDATIHTAAWLPEQPGDDPFNVATVACARGISLNSSFDFVVSREVMRVAQSSINQAQSDYGAAWVSLLSSTASLHDGDFVQAHQNLLAGLAKTRAALGESAGIAGTIALLAAKSAVEMNLDAEARELLQAGLRKFQTHGIVDTAAFGLDAAVKLWRGESDDIISVSEMKELAAAYPPRLSLMLSCYLIRRMLRLDRKDEAILEATHIGLLSDQGHAKRGIAGVGQTAFSDDLMASAEIDLDISTGRMKQASIKVAEQTKLAKDAGRWGRLVELALDEASISQHTHNPAPAARYLSRAITIAAKRRYLRPFRDRADMIAGLVNETKAKDWGFVLEEERRFFAEVCRGLPLANGALLEQLEELNVVSTLSDSPTARELELLTLIEAGLSNQQLADRLSVSVATVKWHLWNLYTKLGVSSRAAALSRAKALNLLSR